jgi:hypothetical protein
MKKSVFAIEEKHITLSARRSMKERKQHAQYAASTISCPIE